MVLLQQTAIDRQMRVDHLIDAERFFSQSPSRFAHLRAAPSIRRQQLHRVGKSLDCSDGNEAGPGPSRFDELFATLLDAIDRRDVRSALYSLFELTSGKGAPKGALQPIEKRILRNPPDGWPTVSSKPVFGA